MVLSIEQKRWIFFSLVLLAGLYIFTPTSEVGWVKSIVEWKLDYMPFIAVKNLMIGLLAYMWYMVFVRGR